MHPSVMRFVERQVAEHNLASVRTLECGSLNVNGSARGLFTGEYVGTDMRAGPGVDVVCNAHELSYPGEFGLALSTEMLEHDDAPWLSLAAMRGCVWEPGHLILTARGYDERGCFPLHGYPSDLWRFSVDGVQAILRHAGWKPLLVEVDPEAPGVFAYATT